ncbi:gliding motility-associated C-terminal domain-containing protein [Flavobacterium flavipallidum]|uniref:Gliding motility-associated C-terminal domain-containing protein n=1 Tax=Flavobacterium flavipallidum TaxID=3139140 RepID=A0ABU9HLS3_9FLAO
MVEKLLFFVKNHFVKVSFFFLIFFSTNSYSQCAGTNGSLTICNIQDPANQNINLFSLLGGSPTTGGAWIDNSKPVGNNSFDGYVNAQTLRNSGVYTYTYVQNPSSCTNNTATVTLKIGPYSGVPSPNVSTCDDVESFSLFQAFDGTKLQPQLNGQWTANTNSASLSGSTIKPYVLGEGTYSYTYTIPALDNCPEQSASIIVSIFRKPASGSPLDIQVCSTVDLTQYKSINLNDRLVGEDAGGFWSEASGTNELSQTYNIIDLEHIYQTLGAGTYNFVYTVTSPNPICTSSQSIVEIIIEDPIDFTGSTLTVNSDICENQIATANYSATITKGPNNVPNGSYDVYYTIDNGTTTKNLTATGNFTNGTFSFVVDRANLPAVGSYIFTVTNIVIRNSTGICNNVIGTITDVLTITPFPRLDAAVLKIDPVCSGFDAAVELSNATNLANGNYRIGYTLSGDNVASNQIMDITVTNGVSEFFIPANLISNVGTNTVFKITDIINLATSCANTANLSKAFTINLSPDTSGISLSIVNECLEGDTVVEIEGLDNLTEVTLDYSLSGANSALNQTAIVKVQNGKGSFVIPEAQLVSSGTTNFTLNSVKVNQGGCTEVVEDNNVASFTLNNCNFFIPDGFSPNGDGKNDVFRILNIQFIYPDFNLDIYNRYGNVLFHGDKNKLEWDGSNSDYKIGIDGIAPNGVYFYVLNFNKGNKKPIQGSLYLNR